jgi:hypothetical protein
MRRPATTSGKATLGAVDPRARALELGEVLVTRAFRGFWALEVCGVRESAWGEGEEQQPCDVVDVTVIPTDAQTARLAGRRLAFAPGDLLRVQVTR